MFDYIRTIWDKSDNNKDFVNREATQTYHRTHRRKMPRNLVKLLSEQDEATKEKAERDLNETDTRRTVESTDLVEWIEDKDNIPKFTDCFYTMAFLRSTKFCQREARNRMNTYWKARNQGIMKVMNNLDPASPEVLNILRGQHAVYLPLPGYDKEGRQVILAKWDQLDVTGQSYSFSNWFRAITLIFDTLCFLDEQTMLNGVTFLMDATGVALKHFTFFGFNNSKHQFKVMQGGYPIRIKKVHYFNNNAVIAFFFNTVKAVLSKKLSERIEMHGYNMEPVYENIGMASLPEEYLPDDYEGPTAGDGAKIMERFIQEKILEPTNLHFLRTLYRCNSSTGSDGLQDLSDLSDTEAVDNGDIVVEG